MARTNENDLYQYQKLNNQFREHYLISAFNSTLDLIEGKKENKDIVLSSLMRSVEQTIETNERQKDEIVKKDKYIKYLQNELMNLINK